MSGDEPIILVCAHADSPKVVPGSIFTHRCQRCGAYVMVAPSGQEVLKANPLAIVICMDCLNQDDIEVSNGEASNCYLAESPEELAKSLAASVPNMRRRRN